MFLQKIQILPAVSQPDPSSPKPLIFWKRISQDQDKELHLFLLVEGRTSRETDELGRELWQIVSSYTNELVINQRGLVNPENICESILGICNDFFSNWIQKFPLDKWSDLNIILSLATPLAIYFARIGEARIILIRNKQIILADENLTQPGSPKFSPPFSEIAGGSLNMGDRFLIASPEIVNSFSFDEISSLAAPPGLTGAFHNMLRSLEMLAPPRNFAFILGNLIPLERPDLELMTPPLNEKIKEARIGDLNFVEFNPTLPEFNKQTSKNALGESNFSFVGNIFIALLELVMKIMGKIFRPLGRKISSLSLTRKIILFAGIGLFIVYLSFVGTSLINRKPGDTIKTDYQAAFSQAENLKTEAESALIYQDEEKVRKNLTQASFILDDVITSSDWGIKALKLQKEIFDQLATLDKAQNSQVNKVWSVPENKGTVKKIFLTKNNGTILLTEKTVFSLKENGDKLEGQEYGKTITLGQEKSYLASIGNELILTIPQNKSYFMINPASKEISDKKELAPEIKNNASAVSYFESSLYFFDPDEAQIKQFSYGNNDLRFTRDWFKQDFKEEFKDDPVVSLSVDGSIFAITKNGKISRFSGGKKNSWNAELPRSEIRGEKLALITKPEYKKLYLLDPAAKRIIIFEKEGGKLAGQVQNSSLGQAVDFQVDETKKELYFATPGAVFKIKID